MVGKWLEADAHQDQDILDCEQQPEYYRSDERQSEHEKPSQNGTWRQILWIASAATSISTTNYILSSTACHYPWRLLLYQQSVAIGILTVRSVITEKHGFSNLISRPQVFLGIKDCIDESLSVSLLAGCQVVCTALSWIFFSQSILHLSSLPVTLMFSAIACSVDMTLFHVFFSTSNLGWGKARTICLLVASTSIILGEYRLTVNGLVMGLIAMVLTGASRTLSRPQESPLTTRMQYSTLMATALFCSMVTGLLTLIFESTHGSSLFSNPVFYLNIIASGVSIVTGASVILPIHLHQRESETTENKETQRQVTSRYQVSAFAAMGLSIGLVLQSRIPPVVSIAQAVAFCVAAVCSIDAFFTNKRVVSDAASIDFPEAAISEVSVESGWLKYLRDTAGGVLSTFRLPSRQEWNASSSERRDCQGSSARVSTMLLKLTGLIWLFAFASIISPRNYERQMPATQLDNAYEPPAEFDVVVSMYGESPTLITNMMSALSRSSFIRERDSRRLFIYTKDTAADLDKIKTFTGATAVTLLPNKGREGETYLHHITTQWDNLARHTLFTQAEVHNPRETYTRIRDYFVSDTGMLSLGFSGHVCEDCESCTDRWGWSDDSSRVVPDLYSRVYANESCAASKTPILLSYKGQFIASAQRIRGIDRDIYADLHTALVDEDSWAHDVDYLHGRKDDMNAPVLGYTLERMWGLLLQCSGDMRIAAKCPSLLSGLSGWRKKTTTSFWSMRWGSDEGDQGLRDCQCLDS